MAEDIASTIATDTPDQSAVSTMVAPDAGPLSEAKQRALEKHFSPEQLAALQQVKAPAESRSTVEQPEQPAAEDVVIDFSAADSDEADGKPAEETTEPELTEDELTGLDEKARKKLSDAHKEAAKVRKRAQEAERKAAELETKLKELDTASTQRGNEIPAELNAANSLSHVTDDRVLAAYEQDARNVLGILEALAAGNDVDTTYQSLVDGKNYELDHTYASWAAGTVLDVEGRRKQLGVLRKAQDTASKIQNRLKETPGFSEALKSITGQRLVTEWPQRRVQAAIGELVTSGQYRLIKISNGKAAGATSPAAVTAPTPKKAAISSPSTPQRELRGTMPAGAPASGSAVSSARLSQLTQQAMKSGHPDDVKALMAAKMELRRANRQGS